MTEAHDTHLAVVRDLGPQYLSSSLRKYRRKLSEKLWAIAIALSSVFDNLETSPTIAVSEILQAYEYLFSTDNIIRIMQLIVEACPELTKHQTSITQARILTSNMRIAASDALTALQSGAGPEFIRKQSFVTQARVWMWKIRAQVRDALAISESDPTLGRHLTLTLPVWRQWSSRPCPTGSEDGFSEEERKVTLVALRDFSDLRKYMPSLCRRLCEIVTNLHILHRHVEVMQDAEATELLVNMFYFAALVRLRAVEERLVDVESRLGTGQLHLSILPEGPVMRLIEAQAHTLISKAHAAAIEGLEAVQRAKQYSSSSRSRKTAGPTAALVGLQNMTAPRRGYEKIKHLPTLRQFQMDVVRRLSFLHSVLGDWPEAGDLVLCDAKESVLDADLTVRYMENLACMNKKNTVFSGAATAGRSLVSKMQKAVREGHEASAAALRARGLSDWMMGKGGCERFLDLARETTRLEETRVVLEGEGLWRNESVSRRIRRQALVVRASFWVVGGIVGVVVICWGLGTIGSRWQWKDR